MDIYSKILITGANGLIGSALTKELKNLEYSNLLTPSSKELNLLDQQSVNQYFLNHKPDYIFHLAALVGGIHANKTYPAQFIYNNTMMQCNVINAALQSKVQKMLFPGSACTYPKFAEQPVKESDFLAGKIEPTNIAYASAKINGIIMAQSYAKEHGLNIVVPMLTNTYGTNDHFESQNSHVIPAMMQKMHDAKIANAECVELWGTGTPLREFICSSDAADAFIFLMNHYDSEEIINVGTMEEISMQDLAIKIKNIVGYKGDLKFNTSKPDGAPRKCLDNSKLFGLGWKHQVSLGEGLDLIYQKNFCKEYEASE